MERRAEGMKLPGGDITIPNSVFERIEGRKETWSAGVIELCEKTSRKCVCSQAESDVRLPANSQRTSCVNPDRSNTNTPGIPKSKDPL